MKPDCTVFAMITKNISDTIEDFANNPFNIGSIFKYPKSNLPTELRNKYTSYSEDVEGGYAKLGNGTFSFLESRESLRYLMRSQFTNK